MYVRVSEQKQNMNEENQLLQEEHDRLQQRYSKLTVDAEQSERNWRERYLQSYIRVAHHQLLFEILLLLVVL